MADPRAGAAPGSFTLPRHPGLTHAWMAVLGPTVRSMLPPGGVLPQHAHDALGPPPQPAAAYPGLMSLPPGLFYANAKAFADLIFPHSSTSLGYRHGPSVMCTGWFHAPIPNPAVPHVPASDELVAV